MKNLYLKYNIKVIIDYQTGWYRIVNIGKLLFHKETGKSLKKNSQACYS